MTHDPPPPSFLPAFATHPLSPVTLRLSPRIAAVALRLSPRIAAVARRLSPRFAAVALLLSPPPVFLPLAMRRVFFAARYPSGIDLTTRRVFFAARYPSGIDLTTDPHCSPQTPVFAGHRRAGDRPRLVGTPSSAGFRWLARQRHVEQIRVSATPPHPTGQHDLHPTGQHDLHPTGQHDLHPACPHVWLLLAPDPGDWS
ncbi:MAG: hypothetical protein HQL63_15810 [Magnetococcales bacterium]|nr:hypothetical protein [Magnetococcales bacterium]